MTDTLTLEQRKERAERRIARFVGRFEPAYYELVCHTALPLVLTPELVSYLRNEFLRELPWIAEVDLLLSDLCSPVGYELYVMDTDVREYVLEPQSNHFDAVRMREVAQLLISYVRYLADHSSQLSDRELETQQWAAMLYLGEAERQTVVTEIVDRFQSMSALGGPVGMELLSRAELARLAQVTQSLRTQLVDYPGLIEYASLVSDVQLRDVVLDGARVERNFEVSPGQFLSLPAALKAELYRKNRIQEPTANLDLPAEPFDPKDRSRDDSQTEFSLGASWPSLSEFDYEAAKVSFVAPPGGISLQTQTLNVGWIEVEPDGIGSELQTFEFKTATIQQRPTGWFRRKPRWVIQRRSAQGKQYIEPLTHGINLEMVAIPSGHFMMGSPKNEPGRSGNEQPQHHVSLSAFFMGKSPVTQAQWRSLANLPQIECELTESPSRFKGDDRPVERVSWQDAMEFCARLSAYTGRTYTLPTEAQWEYACRAGTNTPFAFGDMITAELANYRSDVSYFKGPIASRPVETKLIGQYPANAFGLWDMHGNVWEWCLDHWHNNYEGAPEDASARLTSNEDSYRVLRGGSWFYSPADCRSASRNFNPLGDLSDDYGFRVVCLPQDSG